MLFLLNLIIHGDLLGAMMLLCVWLVLLHAWLALANGLGFQRGLRLVLAGSAVLEMGFQFVLDRSGASELAGWTLRDGYIPVQVATAVSVLLLLFRTSLPERQLPLRGKWLTCFLLTLATLGLMAIGPCSTPVWRSAYSLGMFGQAYGYGRVLGCLLPMPTTNAGAWATLILGMPYLLVVQCALLDCLRQLVQQGARPQVGSSLKRVASGSLAYGRALTRNESLW